jgi:hypothetical protein
VLCIISAAVTTFFFLIALWRQRNMSVVHSPGLGNDALANAIFSFFSKCKLRCADAPPFTKDGIIQTSHQLGWAGLVVVIQVSCTLISRYFLPRFCLILNSQDFLDSMPVGCLLPHAYDPLPIEFRKNERSNEQNVNEPTPNPIGDAHGLFYDEPDIISRAEVPRPSRCSFLAVPSLAL